MEKTIDDWSSRTHHYIGTESYMNQIHSDILLTFSLSLDF